MNRKNGVTSLARPVLVCLFAALISVGAYIAVPLPGTPVPIVLQNLFIMLAAMILGPRWGSAAVALYLCLGALGLPVFSGGAGGLAVFLGPTGGYLAGYLPGVVVMGLVSRLGRRALWKYAAAAVLGMAIVYALGLLRLRAVLDSGWPRALAAGLVPFLPGDAIKIALAAPLASRLSAWLDEYLEEGEGRD